MRHAFFTGLLLLGSAAILTGCGPKGGPSESPPLTAQDRTQLYQQAIENALGDEGSHFSQLVTSSGDDNAALVFQLLNLEAEDMSAYALDVSPVNIQAYGIAAVYPAGGKEDGVLESLNGFIDNQKESFYQYLEDEYETASNTRLETLEDGTILMVMCQDQDTVFDAIRDAIEGAQ